MDYFLLTAEEKGNLNQSGTSLFERRQVVVDQTPCLQLCVTQFNMDSYSNNGELQENSISNIKILMSILIQYVCFDTIYVCI